MRLYIASLWLLSGAPVGLVLLCLPPGSMAVFFSLSIVLDEAHNAAPIALAWSNGEFRRRALRRPWKFVGLPVVVAVVLLAIGVVTQLGWTSYSYSSNIYALTDWTNLLPVAMWVYWPWKIYHFGMQNFGVMQILGIGYRRLNMIFCLAATFFGMAVVPALSGSREVGLMVLATFSVNHWVTDLGLSARSFGRRWWLLLGGLLASGAMGYFWLIPTPDRIVMLVIPIVMALRLMIGFNHFLYSRWVWQRESPVRRAIA